MLRPLKIGLDIQHLGRVRRPGDYGAAVDLDGDGHADLLEAVLTPRIALGALEYLQQMGHRVYIFGDGSYKERHARADSYRLDVYLALHLNAGGGDYGAFFYHPESPPQNGEALSKTIAGAWSNAGTHLLGEDFSVKSICSKPTDWTKNALYTIKGLGRSAFPVGICCEPWFLDNEAHRAAFATAEGLQLTGAAIGRGIQWWAESKYL